MPAGSQIDPGGSQIDPGGSQIDPGGSKIDPGGSRELLGRFLRGPWELLGRLRGTLEYLGTKIGLNREEIVIRKELL